MVARLGNSVLREAVAIGNGPGAILDVADLAAPSVVEACLSRTTHSITVAGIEFVISGTDAPLRRHAAGALRRPRAGRGRPRRELADRRVRWWPARDATCRSSAGDWTAMIGTAEELAAQGIAVAAPAAGAGPPPAETARSASSTRCARSATT